MSFTKNILAFNIQLLGSENATKIMQHNPDRLKEFTEIWSDLNIYKFDYLSDGRIVKGFLADPKVGKNLPCIVFNRGGSKEHSKIDDKILFFLMAKIASWGYIVIASQYSGVDGGQGKDECGGMDLMDVINLKPILENHPNADTNRIGMFGASRGGMQIYMLLKKINWVKAAVIRAGGSNEIRGYKERPELKEFRRDMYNVDSEIENKKRSAIFWVNKLPKTVPLLIIHGSNDESVSPLDALEMGLELFKNKIPNRLIVLEGDDHKLTKNSKLAMIQTKEWLDRFVRDLEKPPVII
jgi:dipeptidyl aminopeptidase/acylaminoacyl peptidase